MSGFPPPIRQLRVADPEGLVGAIRGVDLEPLVLNDHRAESALSRVLLPGSCLDQVSLGPSMWFHGVTPSDCYTMMYVTACPEVGHSFNFNASHRDRCLGFFAPGETLEAATPAGYRQGTLTIPKEAFLESVGRLYPEIPEKLLAKGRAIFPKEEACDALTSLLAATTEVIRQEPESLAKRDVCLALEKELHDHFFGLIRNDQGGGAPPGNPRLHRRFERWNRLREFIKEHRHRRILLHELCEASGLSRRGVEYLFLDLLGISASVFLLRSRLHGVRRELLASPPNHGLVKQAALNWGFWHLGRFASEYQALFGEKPSETLAMRG